MSMTVTSVGGVGSARAIRDQSFFSKSHLTLQKWFILLYWWSHEYPVTDAARIAEVDSYVQGVYIELCVRANTYRTEMTPPPVYL